jgi:membrane protein implicated in regulation of membrane protease activity
LLAGAAVAGVLALVLGATALAWGLAAAFEWPVWLGFAIVAAVALVATLITAHAGRRRLAAGPPLPRTVALARENAEWIRHRTS